jgi:hypothetical protein
MFTFLRSLQVFSKVVALVYIPTSSVRVFLFPHILEHLLLVVLLMMAILTGVRENLSVVLIWISFMARDGEHFFMFFFGHLNFFFFFLSVAQAGLELVILLPHPLHLVDYRRTPP